MHRAIKYLAAATLLLSALQAHAQPCLIGYTLVADPPPVGGTYQSGQAVQFCFTVTFWNSTNANWFHGIAPAFGPGWDVSTLVPGPPPPTCGGSGGTWGWYNSVQGTSFTNIGPQGPGYFFDLDNNGNPGNNFGDFCTGAVNWQFCWTIAVADVDCVNGANLSVSVNTFSDSQTGAWSGVGCGNDPIATAPPAVAECCAADAGEDAAATFCTDAPPVDLFTLIGGTPDAGGTWTAPGGAPHSGTLQPGSDTSGNYTYTVTEGDPPCTDEAVVAITIAAQPDAGNDATLALCSSDAPQSLFALLGPGAQAGGTWTGPGGAAFTDPLDPATAASGMYTYTVAGVAPCVDASAAVQVTVQQAANAGADAVLNVCSNGAAADLFTALGGTPQAGGTWTAPGGGASNGIFTPGVSTAGEYTYTLPTLAPCPAAIAVVTVNESPATDAGTNASATLCDSGAPVVLTSLLGGTPQPGGTWTAPDGANIGGTLTLPGAASGTYTYTVAGQAPCTDAQAQLSLTIVAQPEAGTDGSANLCDASPTVQLITLLGGSPQPGGNWSAPGGGSSDGSFTPGVNSPGAYTYSIAALAPCLPVSATVTVNVTSTPDAGSDGSLTLCSVGAPTPLIDALGGVPQPGGNWTGPGGLPMNGTLDPGSAAPGTYTYTVDALPPCTSASSSVEVGIVQAPDAGIGASATLCVNGPPVDLFGLLGGSPQPDGTWTAPGGGATAALIDPATAASGNYTYTVAGTAPCAAAQAVVNISIVDQPTAGQDAALALCSNSAPSILIDALGGMPNEGGTWTDPDGNVHSGIFEAGTSDPGAYTYTVTAPAPCLSASATVTVSVQQSPPGGVAESVSACTVDAPFPLFDAFGGLLPEGGTWSGPGGGASNGTFTPGTSTAGTYTYTVSGTPPCADALSTVLVSVSPPPFAGNDGSETLCSTGPAYDLATALGGAPSPGGNWTGPIGNSVGAQLDPATAQQGDYMYVVPGTALCPGDTAIVSITINDPADAGAGAQLQLCANDGPLDLFAQLGGTPEADGSWSGPGGGATDPLIDPAIAGAGAYVYTVASPAPCPASTATINVAIAQPPNAGSNASTVLCGNDVPLALLPLLGAGAQAGGTWSGPGGSPFAGTFDPVSMAPGLYTYSVQGTDGCQQQQAQATITIQVQEPPAPAFTVGPTAGCLPLFVELTLLPGTGALSSVQWTLGDGTTTTGGTAAHTFTTPGSFSVSVTVTDANGCTGSSTQNNAVLVDAGPTPTFSVTPMVVSIDAPTVTVQWNAQGGLTPEWTISDVPVDGGAVFSHTWADAQVGFQPVCLTLTNQNGCSNTACLDVLIDEPLTVHVPNAFSPNGDGINDLFAPVILGATPDGYTFTIFDRWGVEVYSTNDLNGFWNGGFGNSGDPLPQAVYVWRLYVRDQFSTERRELFGTVTLLR